MLNLDESKSDVPRAGNRTQDRKSVCDSRAREIEEKNHPRKAKKTRQTLDMINGFADLSASWNSWDASNTTTRCSSKRAWYMPMKWCALGSGCQPELSNTGWECVLTRYGQAQYRSVDRTTQWESTGINRH